MTIGVRNDAARSVHLPTAGLLAQLAVLAALETGAGLGVAGWLAGTGYGLAAWVLLSLALQQPGVRGWGPADTVTLARATLVGGVTALAADSLGGGTAVPVLVILATVALLLDAVDGPVARRTGTVSQFGARFDMETDSVLVLVLSVVVASSLGWWVLAIGAFRYAYGVAAWAVPWLRVTLPASRFRKTVAAMQGIVLVVAATGVLPGPLATALVGLALGLLSWTFAGYVGYLWQVRQRDPVVS